MLYSEKELAVFTPRFQSYLRVAARTLKRSTGRATRSTQVNMALSYWLSQQRSRL